jgi:ATP-dependent Clp protease ATP-binding subunit ClpB
MKSAQKSQPVVLDPEIRSPKVLEFEEELRARIVGQERAVRRMVNMYQIFLAGMSVPGRAVGTLLFLGPTGSGKTRVVEASADILFGSPRAFIKIDCAEFQHSHEIAKLIGSPPGYLGHRETPPLLTQEALDQHHTEDLKLSFVLFDEIEKADDALWQLLLGVLDKGVLTLGDNRQVDFSKTIVVMTSNLGANEMSQLVSGGIGFSSSTPLEEKLDSIDQKIYRTALEAARKKFTPEFMNRIDKVVVFRTLSQAHLRQIVDLELEAVQQRILGLKPGRQFMLKCTNAVKEFLLEEGTDPRYGARHLKRAIERHLVFPLSNLIATGQIELGDLVLADLDGDKARLVFTRERSAPFMNPMSLGKKSRRAGDSGELVEAASEEAGAGKAAALKDAQNVC